MFCPWSSLLALGVVEVSWALLDAPRRHAAGREGSNLISRDTSLVDCGAGDAERCGAGRWISTTAPRKSFSRCCATSTRWAPPTTTRRLSISGTSMAGSREPSKLNMAGSGSFAGAGLSGDQSEQQHRSPGHEPAAGYDGHARRHGLRDGNLQPAPAASRRSIDSGSRCRRRCIRSPISEVGRAGHPGFLERLTDMKKQGSRLSGQKGFRPRVHGRGADRASCSSRAWRSIAAGPMS